jgi:hypothetical protein
LPLYLSGESFPFYPPKSVKKSVLWKLADVREVDSLVPEAFVRPLPLVDVYLALFVFQLSQKLNNRLYRKLELWAQLISRAQRCQLLNSAIYCGKLS